MDRFSLDHPTGSQPAFQHSSLALHTPLTSTVADAAAIHIRSYAAQTSAPALASEQVLPMLDDARKLLRVVAKLCQVLAEALGIRELSIDDALDLGDLTDAAPPLQHVPHPTLRTARDMQVLKQHYQLTERELDILKLVAHGLRNPEIAQKLSLEKCTVEQHLSALYSKLGIPPRSRVALALFAREYNLA